MSSEYESSGKGLRADSRTANFVTSHYNGLSDAEKAAFDTIGDTTLDFRKSHVSWCTRGRDYSTLGPIERQAVQQMKNNYNSAMSTLRSTRKYPYISNGCVYLV